MFKGFCHVIAHAILIIKRSFMPIHAMVLNAPASYLAPSLKFWNLLDCKNIAMICTLKELLWVFT